MQKMPPSPQISLKLFSCQKSLIEFQENAQKKCFNAGVAPKSEN